MRASHGIQTSCKKTPCDGERISLINKGLNVMPPQHTFLDWIHIKARFVVLIDKLFCIFKPVFLHSSTTLVCLSLLQLRFSSSHSVIHATDSMTLDEGSARRRDLYLTTKHIRGDIYAPRRDFFLNFFFGSLFVLFLLVSCLDCSGLCLCLQSSTHNTNVHAPARIRTRNPRKQSAADRRLRPLGDWDRQNFVGVL